MSYWKSKTYLKRLQRIKGYTLPAMEKKRNHPWRFLAFTVLIVLSLLLGWLNYDYVAVWWGQYFSELGR